MTIKTHGRMFTDNTVGITQLDLSDGTENQAIVTDGSGTLRFATVGAGGSVGSSVYIEDIRSGDGTTATFTLSTAAPYEESILVFIDGVAQPTSSFTLPSTTSITFTPAPGNGAAIRICHLGIASSLADCAVTGPKICMGSDAAGDILFYNGTTYQRLGIGTALQVLITNAAVNAVEWVDAATASLPAVGADGNVLTSDGTNWNSETPLGGVGGELVSVQEFVFTTAAANQTWTRPSGVKRIEVQLIGGGGSTGGQVGWGGATGGGGGGSCCIGIFDVTNLTTATIVIGDGTSADAGANKASTFVGTGITTMTAGGGVNILNSITGGAGGTATGGALNFPGEAGSPSNAPGTIHSANVGGHPGGQLISHYGNGARSQASGVGGGAGQHGYCLIREYSDVSASLVGEKLVSHQFLVTSGAGPQYTGTWTKPANVTKIRIYVQGAGGGARVDSSSTGAGGGGGCAVKIQDVTNVTTLAYTIGSCVYTGGSFTVGYSGWDSTGLSAGSYIVTGAGGGSSTAFAPSGGAGGVGNGGDFNISGSVGGNSPGADGGAPGGPFSALGHGGRSVAAGSSSLGTAGYIYIEEYVDASLVSGGSLVPAGVLNPYAGATAPAGWLLCFGQSISRTTYSTLFTAIGTTYGSASGTTFNLPDMRGRVAAGQDDMGGTSANRLTTPLNGDTLGAVGGAEVLIIDVTSGATTTHAQVSGSGQSGWDMTQYGNVQPTIILNYIIKT